MHKGHIYHINKAKEITKCDYVIAIMSGSFTQQGNIAVIDKFSRAKLAIKNGIDMVIELPTAFSVSDAGNFANSAVNLLNNLNCVSSICFGAENTNISDFNTIVDVIINNKDVQNKIEENLKEGVSFAKARNDALSDFLTDNQKNILIGSNNILAIEYLKSLQETNSSIIPYIIKREGSNFNEKNIISDSYTSSTSIREFLNSHSKKDYYKIKKFLPENVYNEIINKPVLSNNDFFKILKYKILTSSIYDIKLINNVTESMENKIKSEIIDSYNYDDYIFKLKSKRYQLSKIKRMLVNILLNISKDDFNDFKNNSYAHILAINPNSKKLLSTLSTHSSIPIITKLNPNIIDSLPEMITKQLKLDIYSSNINSIISNTKINKDYTNFIY